MIDLENFQKHLQALSKEQWESLFSLIPEIEQAQSFGHLQESEQKVAGIYTVPYWRQDEIVDKTLIVLNKFQLYPVFDWCKWEKGQSFLNDSFSMYESVDAETLCKLLTIIIRRDRFDEGYLVACFQKGIVLKILKGLQRNIHIPH